MPDTPPSGDWDNPVRISKIAGQYLVFDPAAAALLRRRDNVSGTLVGTTPQQPTQNVFLGLPIELRPEEADALIRCNTAYVVDAATAHLSSLSCRDADTRRAYKQSLWRRKQVAQQATSDRSARRAADVASRFGRPSVPIAPISLSINVHQSDDDAGVPLSGSDKTVRQTTNNVNICGITPISSGDLISSITLHPASDVAKAFDGPLCRYLQTTKFYMTPGLRFGARYSVYPGDPLRFHAHFMANQYGWHEEIPVLDVVSGGRLATAVKKAFLMGGQHTPQGTLSQPLLCTISVEWAAM
ncbi:tRNA-splicing endonuclease subunit [Purpureocillium takamizusanense]|uniref:tRNA-splicing endonuclease subunit Sen34 n=1 Tax=Purpureocillium takamizusanense TaxID=2060973 RepID=A0A9Q8QIC3_9HYPO|nr:tRNA-splicing endonuclease subunit [Purpureocillium takamizusanense]UNI20378.1 tRNA-splicing endonuclease subunit [Purpureocillium takamizusanense]